MELFYEKPASKLVCHTLKQLSGSGVFHWHENCEMCIVLNKPCNFLIDGELVEADVRDIVIIDEYVVHKFMIENKETGVVIIQFNLSLFMNLEVPFSGLKKHIKYSDILKVPGLKEKIDFLYETMENEKKITDSADENPFLYSLMISFYYLLMKHFSEKKPKKNKNSRDEFFKVAEYIKENFDDDISVNKIADKMYMSRTKLSLLFKKYAGISLNEYINILRIKKVNFLLDSGLEITSAAFESGFQSIRTFNEAYKRVMGISPSDYLKGK